MPTFGERTIKRAVVALSGGLDSTTVLSHALEYTSDVVCAGFCYGSKHNKYENKAAADIARYYGKNFLLFNLEGIMDPFNKSALMKDGGAIPEGHYEANSMSQTVVPGRNTIFAAILAGMAESMGADAVFLGIHAGDHHIYPDCRPAWFGSMQSTVDLSTEGKVKLYAPFLRFTKQQILEWGLGRQVPYQLTRTCYKDQPQACGKCGSCQERLEAFQKAGVTDPLEYDTRVLLPKKLATPKSANEEDILSDGSH